MESSGGTIGQLAQRVSPGVQLWAWPISRILMCAIVYLCFFNGFPAPALTMAIQWSFFAWIGWTVATTLLSISGQPLQPKLLRIIIFGDACLIIAAIMLLRGVEGASVAFAIGVTVIAISVGVASKWLLSGHAVGILTFMLRDFVLQINGARMPTVTSVPELAEYLHWPLLLIVAFMLLIWASRKSRFQNFDYDFTSLRNLSFEKSLEFDLQAWTNDIAALFAPGKAACVIHTPAHQPAYHATDCNLQIWLRDQDRDELIESFRNLPDGCSLFDIELNSVFSPDTEIFCPLDENGHRIARILHRANIKAALVQPVQIDRARGGIICVLDGPLNAITIAEASFISRHISEMTRYLGNMAMAQRNFIADAHDVARRDLHDGVLQTLAALRMRLLLLTKRDDVTSQPIELEIRKAVDIVTLEQSRLRGFLEKSETDDHTVNLVSQIDICVRTISLQWGIDVKLKSDEPAIPVNTESSFNIEHLLREVITNAVRHAKSNSLTVSLSLKQDALMMAVTDLSQPPEGAQVFEKSALTLKSASLRDRLRLVNGEAYAEGLGKGTLLSIRIPMQQIEND